jgi:phosphoribosylanthranilate isomerase
VMRIKICGITDVQQGKAIAQLGATDLGFICYPPSPRYVSILQIQTIIENLSSPVGKIGVFVDETLEIIEKVVKQANLTGIQLHGKETPEFCQKVRQLLPHIELIKALRIKNDQCFANVKNYYNQVDTLLLDAYHPQLLGGTGKTINWEILEEFNCPIPWLLAGGLTPENVVTALNQVYPDGIDLSSGVEIAPGNKDLNKVTQLFEQLLNFL